MKGDLCDICRTSKGIFTLFYEDSRVILKIPGHKPEHYPIGVTNKESIENIIRKRTGRKYEAKSLTDAIMELARHLYPRTRTLEIISILPGYSVGIIKVREA